MVLVAGIGGQGGKAEVIINKQTQREDIGIILVTLTDIRVELFVRTPQTSVIDDVRIEGVPDIAFVDGSVHGAALSALLVLHHCLDIKAIGLKGG